MGNHVPVHRTTHNCSVYFQGVCPNDSRRLPIQGRRCRARFARGLELADQASSRRAGTEEQRRVRVGLQEL